MKLSPLMENHTPIFHLLSKPDREKFARLVDLCEQVIHARAEIMQTEHGRICMHSISWSLCLELCRQMNASDRARFAAKICEHT